MAGGGGVHFNQSGRVGGGGDEWWGGRGEMGAGIAYHVPRLIAVSLTHESKRVFLSFLNNK